MKYDEFVAQVRRRTGLSSNEEAEKITAAVLETLGERIYKTEREDLAAQLPSELRKYLSSRPESEAFQLEEFYNRVRSRADIGYPAAVKCSRIVMEVLQNAVSAGEVEDILSQVPKNFEELFGKQPESPLSPTSV